MGVFLVDISTTYAINQGAFVEVDRPFTESPECGIVESAKESANEVVGGGGKYNTLKCATAQYNII